MIKEIVEAHESSIDYQPFDQNVVSSKETDNIMSFLGGYTSDHTQQSVTAILVDKAGDHLCELSGMTWNTLNKGSAIDTGDGGGKYSNNPFNVAESDEAYATRTQIQMHDLLETIRSGQLDFIFLQEGKFFIDKALSTEVDAFKQELNALGWDYANTKAEDNSKFLLTFWDTNQLDLLERQAILPDGQNEQNTGFELTFTHIESDQTVALANLHLDFMHDHAQDILNHQQENIENDVFTIMGGDTNHPQGYQQIGLLGEGHYASHIGDSEGFQFDENGECSILLSTERMIGEDPFKGTYSNLLIAFFNERGNDWLSKPTLHEQMMQRLEHSIPTMNVKKEACLLHTPLSEQAILPPDETFDVVLQAPL